MTNVVLAVEIRDGIGKGPARAVRRAGQVPGVIYGGGLDPVAISLRDNEVRKALNTGKMLANMIEIDRDGKKQKVIAREVQFHPVTDRPVHVDLFRVKDDTMISVGVTVNFVNEEESPGLKRGGVLNVVRHYVEVDAPAGAIPDHFTVDLTGLEIGDSIHMSSIELPEGVRPTIQDRDFTIATLQGARVEPVEEEELEGVEDEEGEEGVEVEAEGEAKEGEGDAE
jgi:large subunit ribosomal protein L25